MMINTTDLCILILVFVTLTSIQGHEDTTEQNLLCQVSLKVINAMISLMLTLFHLVNIQGRESNLSDYVFKKKKKRRKKLVLTCTPTLVTDFIQSLV